MIGTVSHCDWRTLADRVRSEVGDQRAAAISLITPAVVDRFWAKVATSEGCWMWTGWTDRDGYGQFSITVSPRNQVRFRASRFAHMVATGDHPRGFILHSCDTPSCIRPCHLSVGSQSENIRQMYERGRACPNPNRVYARGEAHHNAKLSDNDVARLRSMWAAGVSTRELSMEFGIRRTTANAIARGHQRAAR